ncbi:MAG: hypothetical protein WBP81_24720 [Solirubrobacteraceae bacterium]
MRHHRDDDRLAPGATTLTPVDFATTLHDGRRLLGKHAGGRWSVHVYSPGEHARLLGYGVASTRPHALERAGLSGEDAGEVLGRIGI